MTSVLRAAACQVDITCAPGVPLGGNVRADKANRGVHDPLWASILLLDDGRAPWALVSLAAAHATLATLASTLPYPQVNALAGQLAEGFREALRRTGRRGVAHSVGPVVQVALELEELASFEDYLRADWAGYDRLLVELLRRGQFALPGGRWYLSTAHTAADVHDSVVAFEAALRAGAADSTRRTDPSALTASPRPSAPADPQRARAEVPPR